MQLPRVRKGEPNPEWPPGNRSDWYKKYLEESRSESISDPETKIDIVLIAFHILVGFICIVILILIH